MVGSVQFKSCVGRTEFGATGFLARRQLGNRSPSIGRGATIERQRLEIVVHRVDRRAKSSTKLFLQIRIRVDWLRQPEADDAILRGQVKCAHAEPPIELMQHETRAGDFSLRHFHRQRTDDLEHRWQLLTQQPDGHKAVVKVHAQLEACMLIVGQKAEFFSFEPATHFVKQFDAIHNLYLS